MKKFLLLIFQFSAFSPLVFLCAFYIFLFSGFEYPELKIIKTAIRENYDIILLGSSVNKCCARSDTDRRSISEILNDSIINKKVIGISNAAYQTDIFYEIITFIISHKSDDNSLTIIVPINLRSFSPQWDLRPSYQFLKEKYYLNGLPYLINFKKYRATTNYEFERYPIFYNNKQIGTVRDFEDRNLQVDTLTDLWMGFVSHYMQPIYNDNVKLLKIKKIDEISQKRKDINIIFYITPIDINKAEFIGIKGFKKTVDDNIKIIKSSVTNSKLIDLSYFLDSEYFDYNRRPVEHLNMYGRIKVAKILVGEIYRMKEDTQ